jgi:hypothetical protein
LQNEEEDAAPSIGGDGGPAERVAPVDRETDLDSETMTAVCTRRFPVLQFAIFNLQLSICNRFFRLCNSLSLLGSSAL